MYIQGNVDHNDTLMFEKWIINVIPGRVLSVDQFSVFTFAARNSGHETNNHRNRFFSGHYQIHPCI